MSKQWCESTGEIGQLTTNPDMRKFCQRPGTKDSEGNNVYMTEQHHKDACDVNKIIDKYDREGVIRHVSKIEAKFGDVSGQDFKEMMDKVVSAQQHFDQLPSNLRKEFDNDPSKLIAFMDDENNRERAIELGLIDRRWTEATDGIGEYVPEGGNIQKPDDIPEPPKNPAP